MRDYAADLEMIQEARERIAPYAKKTPVHRCATIDALMRPARVDLETPQDSDVRLFFKCETFQKGGAFKAAAARGVPGVVGNGAFETEPIESRDATEVYAKPVGLKTSGGIDTFLSDITFGFAGFIVKQRRNEESAMRYLRVIARRVIVPGLTKRALQWLTWATPAAQERV